MSSKTLFGANPDLDDVEFVEAIEAAFGIKFSTEELERFYTFGDLYDATCRHVKPVERGSFPCLAASAYRRIKRAIGVTHPGTKLHPDTRLAKLIADRSVSRWWRMLESESGLKLPDLHLNIWCVLAFFALLIAGLSIATGTAGYQRVAVLLLMILGFIALRWWPKRLPLRTVGELARSVGALNAAALAQPDGMMRERDVWSSLVLIARHHAVNDIIIDRDTALIG